MTICKIKEDGRTAYRACIKPTNKHRWPPKVGVAVRNVNVIAIRFMVCQVRSYGKINPCYKLQ